MVLQKHRGASNQKSNILRRQAVTPSPKPTATPLAPAATKPTPQPKPVTPTRPAQPHTAIPAPSKLLLSLSQATVPTVLPSASNLPPTSSSISAPSTTNSSTSVQPSTSASRTPSIVADVASTDPTPSATIAAANKSTNTGVLIGAIVGGCVALGLIVACVYLLLRRKFRKKKRYNEAFNTSNSRRSAVLLDDSREKPGVIQPLRRSDRHVQNAPLPRTPPVQQQTPYAPTVGYYREERDRCDDPFAAQPSRSVVHQSPYDAQPAYAYPPNVGPYGYNNPHGYPPQAHYALQPQTVAQSQQYDTAPPSDSSLPYARQYDAIPSPAHYARSETSLLHHPEPETPSIAIARDAVSTVQDRHSIEDDEDVPPPAYEITETFVNHRSDVKTRHFAYDAASTISASGSTAAPASVSTSAGPSTEPPSPFYSSAGPSTEPPSPFYSSAGSSTEPPSPFYSSAGPSTEPPSPFYPSAGTSVESPSHLILSPSRHHTLSSRPISGTSAVTIVYE